MSESEIEFIAVFPSAELAEKTRDILEQAYQKMEESEDSEYALQDALYEMDANKGIHFDSLWFIAKIELDDKNLYVELMGSPSGTMEEDIITWIKLNGAEKVSGKAIFDGGGDVDTVEF
jgi:hypothetical protein